MLICKNDVPRCAAARPRMWTSWKKNNDLDNKSSPNKQ